MESIVYHVGDFKNKAETMSQLDGGRSTGYFGTGYYFCTEWESVVKQGGGHRPLYSFDINGLNLIYGDLHLHDALKSLNRLMNIYPLMSIDIDDFRNLIIVCTNDLEWVFVNKRLTLGEYITDQYNADKIYYESKLNDTYTFEDYKKDNFWIRNFIEKLEKFDDLSVLAKELDSKNPNFDKIDKEVEIWKDIYFNNDLYESLRVHRRDFDMDAIQLNTSSKTLQKVCDNIYKEYESFYEDGYFRRTSKTHEMDSFPTMIMKRLGYDGVYPSRECDNTTYGGCIFDLKNCKDITLLAEDVSKYEG